ncbi:MAG: hypothetical protein AAGC49_11690 [Brevundimonas sp.]
MVFRRLTAAVGAAALVLLAAVPALGDPLPVDEPFDQTAFADPAWVLPDPTNNYAHLTGSALELAPAVPPDPTLLSGNATLNDAFRSDVAFTADFDYAAYGGGNPGDAMTFFLMDGAQQPNLGQGGGAAGYVSIQGGYIAVGLSNGPNFGETGSIGNIVVLRGAAAAAPQQWPVLTYQPAPGGTIESLPTAPRHVRILVEPNGATSNFLTVWVDDTAGNPVLVYDHVDVVGLGKGQPNRPATYKLGFSAGIAGATNNYEVTNFTATADVDLSVTKSGPATVNAGGQVQWQIVASNDDTNPVDDAVLTDTLPAGITNATWTCTSARQAVCPTPASGTVTGGTLDVPLSMLRDESATITITGTASDSVAGTSIVNTASITAASRTELTTDDNTATATTRVRALPDLTPTVDVTVDPIVYGQPVTWTVDVDNLTPPDGDAPDARVTVTVPPLIDRASITAPSGCTAVADGFDCDLGTVVGGGTVLLSFTGDATEDIALCTAGTSTFSATVSTSLTDADPSNDTDSAAVPCVVPVDLSIVKSGPAQVRVGDDVDYTIVATNDGAYPSAPTTVTDDLPATLTGATWTCTVSDGSACSVPSGTGDISVTADLDAGASMTIAVTGTASAVGDLVNTASVQGCPACSDAATDDDESTVTTTVLALPDLTPTVTVSTNPLQLGQPATWTVDVDNLASVDGSAPGAAVSVSVPAPIDRSTITPPAGCVPSTAGFDCALGTLAAGGTASLSFTGDVTSVSACVAGDATFSAQTSTTETDADPSNDTDSVDVPCVVPVDLSITKSAPTAVYVGDDLDYTVVATNAAAVPAPGTLVTDDLPAGISGATWTCQVSDGSACSPASGTGDVSVTADLPVGGSVTVQVSTTAATPGTVTNTANVVPCDACTDATTDDHTASATTLVRALPDLAPTVDVTTDPLRLGQPATWTVDVENLATVDGAAPDAAVAVTVPPAIDASTITPPAGCTASATGFDCALGTLAEGADSTLTFTGTVTDLDACVAGSSVFRAETSTSVTDADPSNDVDSVSVPCTVDVDLSTVKVAPAEVFAGDALNYAIVVSNASSNPAPGTLVVDALPGGVTDATWTCTVSDGSACTPASGTGDVSTTADVPARGSVSIRIAATADVPGTISNTATVTACDACTDASADDDSSTAVTVVNPLPDLTPTIDVTTDPLVLGQTGSWSVKVENLTGPPAARLSRAPRAGGPAPGAAVAVTVPSVFDRASITPPAGCTPTAAGFDCLLGTLAAGDSTTLTFAGDVSDLEACLAGDATFGARTSTSARDADPSNDVDTATVACTIPVDLALTKTGPATATVGDEISYTIVATNEGDVAAPDTVLADELPAGLRDATWTCEVSDGAACSPASGSDDVQTVATLAPGASMTVTVTATVSATGKVTNVATATPCDVCTGGSGPQEASATTQVEAAPTPSPTPTPTPTPSPSPSGGPIASTGADAVTPLAWVLVLLVAGGSLLLLRRRRS